MLEGRTKISDCENLLRSEIEKVPLIGYVDLSEEDYQHLASLIREQVARLGYARAVTLLSSDWPAVLSSFLVWTGILHYRAGNYWPAVHEQASLPREQSLQTRLLRAFDKFLKDLHLVTFERLLQSSNINRILAHGLIPNYCLQDFFERLLREFVSGRFRGARADLQKALTEWRKSAAGAMFTDKPVLNFVFSDERIASQFILESIQLAESISRDAVLPPLSTPAVPRRIRELLARWVATGSTGIELETRDIGSRFSTPEFMLDPASGEVAIRVPSQSIHGVHSTDRVTCAVLWDDGRETTADLKFMFKQRVAKTSVETIPCLSRSEALVFLQVNGKDIRDFRMEPLERSTDWFAFGDPSKVLLPQGSALPSRCWILMPCSWSFGDLPGFRVLEESIAFHGPWHGFRAARVETSLGQLELRKPDDTSVMASVRPSAVPDPVLLDTTLVPHCDSDGVPVYSGMPRLMIPAGWSSDPELEVRLRNCSLPDARCCFQQERVGIHRLVDEKIALGKVFALGGSRPGVYQLVVSTPAGKSKEFRFAVFPKLSIVLDRELYWVAPSGESPIASIQLHCPCVKSVRLRSLVSCSGSEPGKWLFCGSVSQAIMHVDLSLADDKQGFDIPLAIRFPHVEFGLSKSESTENVQFVLAPPEISLRDISAGSQLMVRFSEYSVDKVTLQLEQNEQSVEKTVRNGQAVFDLRRFADSFRASKTPYAALHLVIAEDSRNPTIIHAARLRKDWIVTHVHVETQLVGADRVAEIRWQNEGFSSRRRLRLWNLAMPWTPPILEVIQDKVSSVPLRVPASRLPPGLYRLEFFQDDDWFSDDTDGELPEPDGVLIHDVQIGSDTEIQGFLTSLDTTFSADLTRTLVRCYMPQQVGKLAETRLPESMSSADIDALVKSTFALSSVDAGRQLAITIWSQIAREPPSGLHPESLLRTLKEILPQLPAGRREICETIVRNISAEIYGVQVELGQHVRHKGLIAEYVGPDANGKYRLRFRDGDLLIPEDSAKALVAVPNSQHLDYMSGPRKVGRPKN